MNWTDFLADVGAPIFGSLVMAFFIFLTLKYILEGVLGNIQSLTGIISMLEDINTPENAASFIKDALLTKRKIMGFK